MRQKKKVIVVVAVVAVLLTFTVAVLLNADDADENRQKAIDFVKESLSEPGSTMGPGGFETWEAAGDNNMMEVCATYYPHSEEGGGEHHQGVLHEMRWQVNLKNGNVVLIEAGECG